MADYILAKDVEELWEVRWEVAEYTTTFLCASKLDAQLVCIEDLIDAYADELGSEFFLAVADDEYNKAFDLVEEVVCITISAVSQVYQASWKPDPDEMRLKALALAET